jgi:hypothetical protein
MKRAILAVSLAAIAAWGLGCQKETPTVTEPPPGSKVEVVGGMENQIFAASSATLLKLTDGTTAQPVADANGRVRAVSLARANSGGITVDCACGAGCTPGGAAGCIVGIPTGGQEASCGGICEAPNMSCGSCRFWFTQPAAGTIQATWVQRKDAAATTRQ